MKRKLFDLSIVMLSFFICSSCIDDDDEIYVSYGVVQNVSSNNKYEILTDKGNVLGVTKSNVSQAVENGKRVLVNFEILSDIDKNNNRYEVSVNGFYNLLSKPVVHESFIRENEPLRRDSIGDDPFRSVDAWFGGDYINIDFEVYHMENSAVRHMINLVCDDTRANADTLYLTLYHNAYKELPNGYANMYVGLGRSSFKISDLIPAGTASKIVKLSWKQYYPYSTNETKIVSDSGVFKPGKRTGKSVSERGFDRTIIVQ